MNQDVYTLRSGRIHRVSNLKMFSYGKSSVHTLAAIGRIWRHLLAFRTLMANVTSVVVVTCS